MQADELVEILGQFCVAKRREIELAHQEQADLAALTPGSERSGDTAVAFTATDALHMMHTIRGMFNAIMTKFAI